MKLGQTSVSWISHQSPVKSFISFRCRYEFSIKFFYLLGYQTMIVIHNIKRSHPSDNSRHKVWRTRLASSFVESHTTKIEFSTLALNIHFTSFVLMRTFFLAKLQSPWKSQVSSFISIFIQKDTRSPWIRNQHANIQTPSYDSFSFLSWVHSDGLQITNLDEFMIFSSLSQH